MREIKFRAWDGKKFGYVSIGYGRICWPAPDYFDQKFSGIREGSPEQVRFANVEDFQQFTGLKDKAGQEIFEGDILEEHGKGQAEPFAVKEMLPLVRFYENYPSPNKDDWMSWPEMYVVIGNIYENPELLS